MITLKKIAIIAGIGYLVIFFTGIYANFFVLEGLVVPDDAAKTAANITANSMLYRFGILNFVFMVIFDVVLTWALYVIFRLVDKNISLLAAWFRLVNCAVFGAALYFLFEVLHLLSGAKYLSVFTEADLHAQVMGSLNAFNYMWLVGLIFFGVHLLFLGYMIYKSEIFPRIIGILLFIAGAGYLTDSFANFMLPSYNDYKDIFMIAVVVPGVVGELSLTFWLLFKSGRLKEYDDALS